MIYITGDTHAEYYDFMDRVHRFPISADDIVIICGDFGLGKRKPKNRIFLERVSALPFTTAFIDGNHEDFDLLDTYHVVEWNGGKAHKIN